jgi:N-acetylglutamate synthase-like GNAT family acetyltransferase
MENLEITYKFDVVPEAEEIIDLYESSGLPRPTQDANRIKEMFSNSDLVVTAWAGKRLVGLSRSITDWVWSCYLADLAVCPDYKKSGIGKKLVALTREKVGNKSMVLLLSVPTALEYYPKIGMQKVDNGFIIHRTE